MAISEQNTNMTVEEWEKHFSCLIMGDIDLRKKINEEEFHELRNKQGWRGVDYGQRISFLELNGYEVTRENLINPNLSNRE